jgi:hypothetical protein
MSNPKATAALLANQLRGTVTARAWCRRHTALSCIVVERIHHSLLSRHLVRHDMSKLAFRGAS